ncbi:MAG: hypothetical protein FWJ92_08715 [Actinomycetes bacterium]|nr:hypothetical protein [Acidimicrobiia bacterium]
MVRRRLLVGIVSTLLLGACLGAVELAAPASGPPPTTEPTTSSTTTSTTAPPTTSTTIDVHPPRALIQPCPPQSPTPPPITGDPVTASVETAHSLVCSATDVVVAPAHGDVVTATRVADAIGAPLVYATADQPYDPTPLGAARVWTSDADVVVGGMHSILPYPEDEGQEPNLVPTAADGEVADEEIVATVEAAEPAETVVLVSAEEPLLGVAVSATAEAVGGEALWAKPGDLRRRRLLRPVVRESTNRRLVGAFSEASPWQLDVLADAPELPGGGHVLFPGRRLVAMYGHPHTASLGVLGEQPVDEAVARAAEIAAAYQTDDTPVLPTFEIIATTATAGAGEDGDYSAELSVDDLRPWVEAAAEAGYYVVLDLQPGRTDFLTQAKRYEELLRLPHVGLALDPEWRLGPDQRHLQQIGSVSAKEINTVVDWLAGIVRDDHLPQKLLVVHQFRLSMITEREEIRTPPELAVVIQMDGQGPLQTKYDTWNALLAAGEGGWRWGWKNFYDEDRPMATPEQVLDLEPQPVFISFQ